MTFSTAELCDHFADQPHFQIADPVFKSFGGKTSFHGQITTLKIFEDNALLAETVAEKVEQRVLVIDGGGSHRCALLDKHLAKTACDNGWQGVVIYGCVRNIEQLKQLPLGIFALHAHPLQSHQRGIGEAGNSLTFAGVNFKADYFLYADADGIVVAESRLV
jgi:regulator of ribonuclease activity A